MSLVRRAGKASPCRQINKGVSNRDINLHTYDRELSCNTRSNQSMSILRKRLGNNGRFFIADLVPLLERCSLSYPQSNKFVASRRLHLNNAFSHMPPKIPLRYSLNTESVSALSIFRN